MSARGWCFELREGDNDNEESPSLPHLPWPPTTFNPMASNGIFITEVTDARGLREAGVAPARHLGVTTMTDRLDLVLPAMLMLIPRPPRHFGFGRLSYRSIRVLLPRGCRGNAIFSTTTMGTIPFTESTTTRHRPQRLLLTVLGPRSDMGRL